MVKIDPKKIIQALPQDYYVIDINNYKIVDSNCSEVTINKTHCYEHLYGFNKSCDEIHQGFECTCKKVASENSPVETEQFLHTPKGYKTYRVKANPLRDNQGKITHILTQYNNIREETKLKNQLEDCNLEQKTRNEEYLASIEELKEQKEEYETLYEELKEANREIETSKKEIEGLKDFFESIHEAVQDGIWVTDKNDVIFYSNPGMEKIAGISRLEIINKNVLKHFYPETIKELLPFFEQAKKELRPVWYEVEVKTPAGISVFQNGWLVPRIKNGAYFGMICTVRDITERVNFAKRIKESEQRYRRLTENSPEITYIFSLKRGALYWSSRVKDILGLDPQELQRDSKIWTDSIHADHKKEIQDFFKNAKPGKSYSLEYRIYDTKGKIHWFNDKIFNVYQENGDTIFEGIISDITEEKEAELALKQSEEKFKRILKNAKDMIYRISLPDGEYQFVSDAAADIAGCSLEKIFDSPFIGHDLVHPDWKEYYETGLEKIKQGIISPYYEYKIIDHKGKEKWLYQRSNLVFDDKDRPIAIEGVVSDISELKEAEEALKESEEKYRSLVENIQEFVFLIDKDFKIISLNQSAKNFIGVQDDYMGTSLKDVFPEYIYKGYKQGLQRVFETGEYLESDTDMEVHGQKFYVQASLSPLKNEKGETVAVIGLSRDITQQKNAEIALRDNEQKLRNITENSTNLFYQHTTDHKLNYVSPQVKDILGYTVDEAMVKWTELATNNPINEEGFKLTMKAIKTGKTQPTYNLELQHKTGRKVWVEVREAPLIEKGKVIGIVGALTDVTKEKMAQDALKESEKRYRKLFESANVGIGISTVKGEILAVNRAMTKIFGYSQKAFLEMNIRNLYVDLNDRKKIINLVKEKDAVDNFQVPMTTKSGKTIEAQISVQALDLEEDAQLLFVISDITREKQAEKELLAHEKKFRTYIEMSPIAIFIANENGKYQFVNQAASAMLGYTKEELMKMSIPDILDSSAIEMGILYFNQVKKEGRSESHEMVFKSKNNVHISVIIDAIKISDNQFIAFCKDITDIKKYEAELKEKNEEYYALNEELEENIRWIQKVNSELKIAKEKAEESDRLKSAFLANMSHEIRTPLNGILGFSALLRKKGLNKEAHNRYSTIIESSGKRLLSVVNDVFDISLIQADQMKIEKATFAVNDLLDEVYTLYQTLKEEKVKNIQFKLIKGSDEEIKIITDQYRLHQIFKNLIDNAFKFTHEGEVEFGYLPIKDDEITFYVKDTGIGIPENHQVNIFSAFRQVDDSITRDYEGAGLGLSICEGLLQRMGGKIWIQSKPDKGSTFFFTLPLNNRRKENKPMSKKKVSKNLLNDKMILIVEDDLVSFEFLKIFLENMGGGGIIQTSSGEEALAIVEKNKIDLIFMDIRLPGIDGYETTRKIRKVNKKVKIIAQTAYALQNDREKCIQAGCNDYLTKPLKENELIEIIEMIYR